MVIETVHSALIPVPAAFIYADRCLAGHACSCDGAHGVRATACQHWGCRGRQQEGIHPPEASIEEVFGLGSGLVTVTPQDPLLPLAVRFMLDLDSHRPGKGHSEHVDDSSLV